MYKVTSNITIGNIELPFFIEGFVKSSWNTLTDTAKVVLPRKITIKDKDSSKPINEVIKRGDQVIIKLGYDDNLTEEFTGYVTSVSTGTPLAIECEDEMWKLKQAKVITATWKSVTLKEAIKTIAPGYQYNFHDENMNLGALRIDRVNPAQALDLLRSAYGLKIYFKSKVLHVGFAYSFENSNVAFDFNKNIVDEKDSLTYQNEDDVKVKVTGISLLPNNQKIQFDYGDDDGAQRTLHYYNLQSKELQEIVKEDFKLLKFSGYSGSFTAFHEPVVNHGDTVSLTSKLYPEHNGTYFVDETDLQFGYNKGIKRIITIGKKSA